MTSCALPDCTPSAITLRYGFGPDRTLVPSALTQDQHSYPRYLKFSYTCLEYNDCMGRTGNAKRLINGHGIEQKDSEKLKTDANNVALVYAMIKSQNEDPLKHETFKATLSDFFTEHPHVDIYSIADDRRILPS